MATQLDLLNGMTIFVEVVNSGSFTKAAQNTGHSTSYISKEINKLEARLGVRLLNRTTRSIGLTPEGKLYFQPCQQILHDAEEAENAISGKQSLPKGTLKVSCPVSFGLSRLRPVLAMFTAAYPDIKIELELNDRKVDIVSEGYDVVIRASNKLEDSSLISRRFMSSHAVVVASPEYLNRYGTPTKPAELPEHQTISYSYLKQPNLWEFTDQLGNIERVIVDSHVLTNSPEMEIALCLAGQGIIRMPYFNLKGEIESGELIELFNDYQKQQITVYLVYPSRKHMSSKVRCFSDFVVEHLGDT